MNPSSSTARGRAFAAIAVACTLAIIFGGGSISASAAPAAPGRTFGKILPTAPTRGAQQASIESAIAQAQSVGAPVAVEGMTTPTEQTLAMPDGTMQYEAATLPVRAEKEGAWVPVDTTLARVGDWLEPVASAAPVRFSPGGTDELAQVQTDAGEWVTERWPYGALPAPVVEGDTATYPDVLPDVDLKMVATLTGQTSIYVVKTEAAAKSAQLDGLHVVIDGAELTSRSNGSVNAETADGSQLVAGNPLWWDSSSGGDSRAPGGFAPAMPVAHEVAADRVMLDVGESVAAEEKRSSDQVVYPIFVDPDWSPGLAASWYTDKAFSGVSYPSTNPLRVGVSSPYHSDMFFQFPLTGVSGTTISAAVLSTTMTAVLWCSPDPIDLRVFDLTKPDNFTWNQELGIGRSDVLQTQNPGNCGSPLTTVAWNAQHAVASTASAGMVRFGITSALPRSRRHFLPSATLTVSYNTRPSTPTAPVFSSPARSCGTASAPVIVGQTDVAVSVDQRDPDGGNVRTYFHLAKPNNLTWPFMQVLDSGLAAGGTKTGTFTGLVNGQTYAWMAQGHDGALFSPGLTEWCYFTVDTTKPAVPSVTAAAGSTFTVGQGVNVSVTGANDVAGYVYWTTSTSLVSPSPAVPTDGAVSVIAALPDCATTVTNNVRWACKSGAATALTVAPTDSLSTVWVSAYDKAGNQSAPAGFALYAGANTNTPAASANLDAGHAWQLTAMSSPLPATIPDSNPWIGAGAVNLIIPPGASTTTTDLPDPPVVSPVLSTSVSSAASEVHSSGRPVDASKSFTFSLWVKPARISATPQVVAIQNGPGVGTMQLQITSTGKYAFCLGDYYVNMSNTARDNNCATGGAVTPGAWQMVTGIWDAANQQLRLHVGSPVTPVAVNGHVNGAGDRTASGPLMFGPGPDSLRFHGLIANPVIVPAVMNQPQLSRLAAFELPFTD